MKGWVRLAALSMLLIVHLWFRFASHTPSGCAQSDCLQKRLDCCWRFSPEGSRGKPVPPTLRLVSATSSEVTVTWADQSGFYQEQYNNGDQWEFTIYRQASGENLPGDWQTTIQGRANGDFVTTYTDRSAVAGRTYSYRVVVHRNDKPAADNPERRDCYSNYSDPLSVNVPAATPSTALAGLTLSQPSVVGGSSLTGTVTLTLGAPTGGTVVTLQSSNPGVASVPSSVTVQAGQTSSAPFTITTQRVTSLTPVTITATYNNVPKSATLDLLSATAVADLTLGQSAILGGGTTTGTVTLTLAAGSNTTVDLKSSDPSVASVPTSVTVAAQSNKASFTINTTAVTATRKVTITASLSGGNSATKDLSVESAQVAALSFDPPMVSGGQAAELIVTLTGAAPVGGLPIDLSLTTNGSWLASPPRAVTVRAGQLSQRFGFATNRTTNTVLCEVTAPLGNKLARLIVVQPQTRLAIRSRGTDNRWMMRNANGGFTSFVPFPPNGESGTEVSRDYDGLGSAQRAVYRPDTGEFLIEVKGSSQPRRVYPGLGQGGTPVPADYDGIGKVQFAIYWPADGVWKILKSTGKVEEVNWPLPHEGTDKPVPGNYAGDGRVRLAIYRPRTGEFIVRQDDGTFYTVTPGQPNDLPVPGNYDGTGKTLFAVYRPSNQTWYFKNAAGVAGQPIKFGEEGDTPLPGAYLNDGRDYPAVYGDGLHSQTWRIWNNSNTPLTIRDFVVTGFDAVPAPFADNFGN